MLHDGIITINGRKYDRIYAETYVNEFCNTNRIGVDATLDFRKFFAKSLITNGTLELNSETLRIIFQTPLNELFTKEFRNIFLYDALRDLKDNYTDIESIKNKSILGSFDIMSSLITPVTAKCFPLIEPFTKTDEELFSDIDISDLLTETIDVEVWDEDLRDYVTVTKTIDLSENFSEQDILNLKINRYNNALINTLRFKLRYFIDVITELFSKRSLIEITDMFSLKSDKYDKSVIQMIYTKIFEIFQILMIRLSINTNIIKNETDINHPHIDNILNLCLSKLTTKDTLMDLMDVKTYFSKEILKELFNGSIIDNYEIVNPVINGFNVTLLNPSKTNTIMSFTENLMVLKSLINSVNLTEENISTLFGVFLHTTVILIQTIFMNGYLMDSKQKIISNVETILKYFEPLYDSILPSEELFKISEKIIKE